MRQMRREGIQHHACDLGFMPFGVVAIVASPSRPLSTHRDGICTPGMMINGGITCPFADIDSTVVTLIVSCASVKTGSSTSPKVHRKIPFLR
ncbi:Uncharacterized protein HZ326_31075 [Fusarium oxysporum f. sp. albedinis]|nr:Uncharacterized protein HZ326_31075 [Fusarium oxysporum f. sp. albedinis]